MPTLPPPPPRIAALPVDPRGYPIPWFVATLEDGTRDFRVIEEGRKVDAIRFRLCWICGVPLGVWQVFVIGAMCAVNRTSGEPPCHLDCARYAASACPFLTRPQMRRRPERLPSDASYAGGALERNGGVALLWTVRRGGWRAYRSPEDRSILFNVGAPLRVEWYAQGRSATRAEVLRSIDTGLPILLEVAQGEGPEAVAALGRMHADALALVPA